MINGVSSSNSSAQAATAGVASASAKQAQQAPKQEAQKPEAAKAETPKQEAASNSRFLRNVEELGKAVKSGDFKAAAESLKQITPPPTAVAATANQTDNKGRISVAVNELDKALKAGDVAGADKVLKRLQDEAKYLQQRAPQEQRQQTEAKNEIKKEDAKIGQDSVKRAQTQQAETLKVDAKLAETIRQNAVEAAAKPKQPSPVEGATVGTKINIKA